MADGIPPMQFRGNMRLRGQRSPGKKITEIITPPMGMKEDIKMDYEWLENGDYWIHVEEMRTSIMRDAMAAKTEAQTVEAFQRQIYYFIR